MSALENHLTLAEAATELGVTPDALRGAIARKALNPVRIDGRTYMLAREEVERYRRENLGRRGKRPRTEDPPKQQAYQQAYYQRRKAARQQPAAEPAE